MLVFLKWLVVVVAVLYGSVVAGMYLFQRRLVFDLRPNRVTPAAAGFALSVVPASRLVLFGYSLGSGVAVPLAARHDCAALILFAPFSSAVAVGAAAYPLIPVRFLMHDQFRSDEVIAKVKAPILMVHGERDQVIPFRFGRELFDAAADPKRFVAMPHSDHFTLFRDGGLAAIREFLGGLGLS